MAGFRWMDVSDPLFWRCSIPANYTVDEWAAEFDHSTLVLSKLAPGVRFVFMADLRQVSRSDPRNRARAGQFMRDCDKLMSAHVVAMGVVVSNAVLAGAVTAVTWIADFPIPTKVFTDRRACEDWLAQQLALDQLARERR